MLYNDTRRWTTTKQEAVYKQNTLAGIRIQGRYSFYFLIYFCLQSPLNPDKDPVSFFFFFFSLSELCLNLRAGPHWNSNFELNFFHTPSAPKCRLKLTLPE